MTALIDINVVLDVLLERQPFFTDSEGIWLACDDGRLAGYIAATTPTTIFYIARKLKGEAKAREAVELSLRAFGIGAIDRQVLQSALALPGSDYEDNVQIACAQSLGVDAICTRDVSDFVGCTSPVLTPAELLSRL